MGTRAAQPAYDDLEDALSKTDGSTYTGAKSGSGAALASARAFIAGKFERWLRTDRLPGKFIAVEGLEAAGKTTRIGDLAELLKQRDQRVIVTRRGSSWIFHPLIQLAERLRIMTPAVATALYFLDYGHRLRAEIIPALRKGSIVIADRWYLTDLARTALRSSPKELNLAESAFSLLPKPEVFFLSMPPEQSIARRGLHLAHEDQRDIWRRLIDRLDFSLGHKDAERFSRYKLYRDRSSIEGVELPADSRPRFERVQHALYREYLKRAETGEHRVTLVNADASGSSSERKRIFLDAVSEPLDAYRRGEDLKAELRRRDSRVLFIDYDGNFAEDGAEPTPEAFGALQAVVDQGIQVEFVSMGVGRRLAANLNGMPIELRARVRLVSEGGVVGRVGSSEYIVENGLDIPAEDRARAEKALDDVMKEYGLAAELKKQPSIAGFGLLLPSKDDALAQRIAAAVRDRLSAAPGAPPQVVVSAGAHVDIRFAGKQAYVLKRMRELGLRPEQVVISGDSAYPGGGDADMFDIPGALRIYSGPERSDVPSEYIRTESPGPKGVTRFLTALGEPKPRRSNLAFLLGVFSAQFARFSITATIPLVFSEVLKAPGVGFMVLGLAALMEMLGTIVGYGFSDRLHKMLKMGTAAQAVLLGTIPLFLWMGFWSIPLIAAVYIVSPILFAMNDFSAETLPALLTKGDDHGLRKLNAWQSFAIEGGAFFGPATASLLLSLHGLSVVGLIWASAIIPAALTLSAALFRLMPPVVSDASTRKTPESGAGTNESVLKRSFGWLSPVVRLFTETPSLFKYPLLFLSLGAYVFFALPPMRQILPAGYSDLLLHDKLQAPWLLSIFGIGGALGSVLFGLLHRRLTLSRWVALGGVGTALLALSPFLGGFWPMMLAFLIFSALNAMARAETKSMIQALSRKLGPGVVELANAFMRIVFKAVSMLVIFIPSMIIRQAHIPGSSLAAHPLIAFAAVSTGLSAMALVQWMIARRIGVFSGTGPKAHQAHKE